MRRSEVSKGEAFQLVTGFERLTALREGVFRDQAQKPPHKRKKAHGAPCASRRSSVNGRGAETAP
jgi:hypothetical protein